MEKSSSINKEVIQQFLKARQENEETLFQHPSYKLEHELLYWMEETNEERAAVMLSKINNLKKARLSDNPVRSLKNSLICSCTLFARATIKAGVSPEYAYDMSDVFIRNIENTNQLHNLQNLEYDMLHHFIQAIVDFRKFPYQNDIIDRAISYIHDHILQPITLEEAAEAISVSSNYLSSLFHEIVNIRFSEYVNRKKIHESKYFLHHTDSTLLDIALLFGYCNQSYYTNLFKRFNHMTPAQFKRSKE